MLRHLYCMRRRCASTLAAAAGGRPRSAARSATLAGAHAKTNAKANTQTDACSDSEADARAGGIAAYRERRAVQRLSLAGENCG